MRLARFILSGCTLVRLRPDNAREFNERFESLEADLADFEEHV